MRKRKSLYKNRGFNLSWAIEKILSNNLEERDMKKPLWYIFPCANTYLKPNPLFQLNVKEVL